jgi:hypothetical protein
MKTIWILIYVHHGLIQEPEIFSDEQSALKKKKTILKHFNEDYDEIEVFESSFDF